MNVVGIIAEYNPFHNGHARQLAYARDVLGADHIIVALSGPFTQRGTPAIFDKYERTRQALSSGADLVFELPVCYACASAEYFASAGLDLLCSTGVVTSLLCGCETPDPTAIRNAAKLLLEEPPLYKETLRRHLAEGLPFPKARMLAMESCRVSFPLDRANNILAVEYQKALERTGNPMPLKVMERTGDYHSHALDIAAPSAAAVRAALLLEGASLHEGAACLNAVPPENRGRIAERMRGGEFLAPDDVSLLLHRALLEADDLSGYFDSTPELAARIEKHLDAFLSFTSFCDLLKTKNLTHSRIRRVLCHILLGIDDAFAAEVMRENRVGYLRLLGFRKQAEPLLRRLCETASRPLLTSPRDAQRLDPAASRMFSKDLLGADLYRIMLTKKAGHVCPTEWTQKLLVVE